MEETTDRGERQVRDEGWFPGKAGRREKRKRPTTLMDDDEGRPELCGFGRRRG